MIIAVLQQTKPAIMTIEINGRPTTVAEGCKTLSDLLKTEGLEGPGQAVAVNNRVVPRASWAAAALEEGMKVTVIRAVCGG